VTEPEFEAPAENIENQPDPAPESSGEPAPRRGRGRPRARETLERDQQVFDALDAGPMTREQLAEKLNAPASLIYLALWRLSHQDPPRVVKITDGAVRHAWQRA